MDNRKLDRPLSASLGIFGLVNVASVWWVCVSTAAAELDNKYFCTMKYFCILSPWCSFSANLVRSISPHRMHFRFWFKRYVIAGILPAKMRPRTNIFHAKKAKSHNSFALPLCSVIVFTEKCLLFENAVYCLRKNSLLDELYIESILGGEKSLHFK